MRWSGAAMISCSTLAALSSRFLACCRSDSGLAQQSVPKLKIAIMKISRFIGCSVDLPAHRVVRAESNALLVGFPVGGNSCPGEWPPTQAELGWGIQVWFFRN